MKTKACILILMIVFLCEVPEPARAGSATDQEYKIKAAFIYNFTRFIDWSKEKTPDNGKTITIGVIGADRYLKAFDLIKGEPVKGKKIAVKDFGKVNKLKELQKKNDSRWKEKIAELKKCRALFICSYDRKKSDIPVELLKAMKGSGVLMVGEMPGFLENGGVINFVMKNDKVLFEINLAAAKSNGLEIDSQLLELAIRVIKNEKKKGN